MSNLKQWILSTAALLLLAFSAQAADYRTELAIPYCTVDGIELHLNAFLPPATDKPAPAMVHIHGGWWTGGGPTKAVNGGMWTPFTDRGIAVFSIEYRLGEKGGFPQNIRDCRNAIRFIRKNAERFGIDPNRIGAMGGSAGGHLTMMVAMVAPDYDDGGASEGLEGVSAAVQAAFPWIGPTNLAKQWDDSVEGTPSYARKYHGVLFHGVTPETPAGRVEYLRMSPVSYVRPGLPPMLICDGEKDPIVPGTPGKALVEELQKVGVDADYWMTVGGGHGNPGGEGFSEKLAKLLDKLVATPTK